MSLLDVSLTSREMGHPSPAEQKSTSYMRGETRVRPESSSSQSIYSQRDSSYDDPVFDAFLRSSADRAVANLMSNDLAGSVAEKETASIMETTEAVDGPPPALPPRSARRASRMLDGLNLKLGPTSMEVTSTASNIASSQQAATPLDIYLSSEEDASSSADDFSDYDFYSDVESVYSTDEREQQAPKDEAAASSEKSPERPANTRRRSTSSHEVTARAVSFVYVGKAAIVEVLQPRRRSMSPTSVGRSRSNTAGTVYSTATTTRRESTAETLLSTTSRTTNSSAASSASSPPLTRHTSATSLVSSVSSSSAHSRKPSALALSISGQNAAPALPVRRRPLPPFLNIDPFANGSTYSLDSVSSGATANATTTTTLTVPEETDNSTAGSTPRTPKTPTAMFRSMQRTLSLVRKRSRPSLATRTDFSASASIAHREEDEEDNEVDEPLPITVHAPAAPQQGGPVTYNDILRNAKRNASSPVPQSPASLTTEQLDRFPAPDSPLSPLPNPNSKRGLQQRLGGFAMGRRRSVRAGSGKA